MNSYLREENMFRSYLQFPEFLLCAPLGPTAKLVYAVLYDRARLSQSNGWNEDGRIYVVYPVVNLMKRLGKSRTVIKDALNELRDAGLLVRKPGTESKANVLWLLVPNDGAPADGAETQPADGVGKPAGPENRPVGKAAGEGSEKRPAQGRKTALEGVGKAAPNKVTESNDSNQMTTVKGRSAYGRYENVFLSEAEYAKLSADYPGRLDGMIENMSAWLAANTKSYKNYEAALRNWAQRDAAKVRAGSPAVRTAPRTYTCREGESF